MQITISPAEDSVTQMTIQITPPKILKDDPKPCLLYELVIRDTLYLSSSSKYLRMSASMS